MSNWLPAQVGEISFIPGSFAAFAGKSSYTSNVSSAISTIAGDASVKSELSPGGRAALDLMFQSLSATSSGNFSRLTDDLTSEGLRIAASLLKQAAVEAGLSSLVEGVGGAIPLLGAAVNVVSAIANTPAAQGLGYSAEDQQKYCSTPVPAGWFRPVKEPGTGPGGVHVPADLLVYDSAFDAKGKQQIDPTDMGWVLQLLTETIGASSQGLSPKRRAQYERLRRAIQATHKRFGTDGGATLWILYIDMLRADFDAGRLSQKLMQYLHVLEGGAQPPIPDAKYWLGDEQGNYNSDHGTSSSPAVIAAEKAQNARDKRDIAQILLGDTPWSAGSGQGAARKYAATLIPDARAHELCGLWTGAARQQVLDLLTTWRQTLNPYYTQFESLEAMSTRIAEKNFGKRGGTSPLLLGALAAGAYSAYRPAQAMALFRRGTSVGRQLVSKVRGRIG